MLRLSPGTLTHIGPITLSTGGCVPNTGLALHRLGVPIRLLAKIGDDPLGGVVQNTLAAVEPELASGLLEVPGEATSYSVILSPQGEDRTILHYPGANDTFIADDLPDDLRNASSDVKIFHFGYPPVMRRMFEDSGENLRQVLQRAKAAGLTTSLDMTYPDPASEAGEANWDKILQIALPEVDVFLPSLEEILLLLKPEVYRVVARRDPITLAQASAEDISRLGDQLVELGTAVVGIKAGDRGLYLRTASEERLKSMGAGFFGNQQSWADRELWSSTFETEVVGTTSAGDAAVAGFLRGLLESLPPEEALTVACAVGASSVEMADATSGIRSWEETRERITGGWTRSRMVLGDGWEQSEHSGVWVGPRDAGRKA
jgi:sugar/nucleoside kinase (ribokinase family)